MTTLNESVITVVNNLNRDSANVDIWVNGNDTATYQATGGELVPSIQKLVKDFEDRTEFTGEYVGGGTAYTRGQTFNEGYVAYVVTADFTSTDFASDAANYKASFDLSLIVQEAIDAKDASEAAQALAEAARDAAALSETNAATSETNAASSASDASDSADHAEEWANANEDVPVSVDAGGDGATTFSSKHHALKAEESATDAAASAAVAVSASAAAVNPKAFAGGVYLDGSNGIQLNNIYSFEPGCSVVLNVNLKSGETLFSRSTAASGEQAISFDDSSGGDIRFDDNSTNFVRGTTDLKTKVTGVTAQLIFVYSTDGTAIEVYLNGALEESLDASGLGSFVYDLMGEHLTWGAAVNYEGNFSGFAHFNAALTAAQAAEIYNQGVSAWLAANPEYKWASPDTYDSDFSSDTDGWDDGNGPATITYDAANDRVQVYHVGSDSRVAKTFTDFVPEVLDDSKLVKISASFSGVPTVDVRMWTGSSFVNVINNWDGSETLLEISYASDQINLRPDGSGVTWYLEGFTFERVGCLAHLPMDEGIGYQLHDNSPNHFDALLPETGFEHLQPKREGYVRDFNLDASSSSPFLVGSTRDLLPNPSFVSSVTIRNNGTAIGASEFELRRSDGSSNNTISTLGYGVAVAQGGITLPDADQIPSYGRVRVATDSNVTDVDVRVDYKLID